MTTIKVPLGVLNAVPGTGINVLSAVTPSRECGCRDCLAREAAARKAANVVTVLNAGGLDSERFMASPWGDRSAEYALEAARRLFAANAEGQRDAVLNSGAFMPDPWATKAERDGAGHVRLAGDDGAKLTRPVGGAAYAGKDESYMPDPWASYEPPPWTPGGKR